VARSTGIVRTSRRPCRPARRIFGRSTSPARTTRRRGPARPAAGVEVCSGGRGSRALSRTPHAPSRSA
jgi:hypothetical protein